MMVAERNRRRMASQRRVIRAIDRHLELLQVELSELEPISTAPSGRAQPGRPMPTC
jgi:hypothetical protein